MGMHLTAYIGPYIEAPINKKAVEIYEIENQCLRDLRVELGHGDKFNYFGPNKKIKSIKRETDFDFYSDFEEVLEVGPEIIAKEIELFKSQFATAIAKVVEEYGEVKIKWGVVPCYS